MPSTEAASPAQRRARPHARLRASILALLACVAAAPPGAADGGIGARLAAADPATGEAAFTTCKVCHSTAAGADHHVGPNLWNVVGRDVASADGYGYSAALRELPGRWTFETLDAFLASPASYAPGTQMIYPGIDDPAMRAAVILHLRGLSDSPAALPAGADAAGAASAAADPFGEDWPEGAGRRQTGFLCNACHSLAIVKQQRLSRARWDQLLDYMVEEQGMPELDTAGRERVLDYLAGHFGTDTPR